MTVKRPMRREEPPAILLKSEKFFLQHPGQLLDRRAGFAVHRQALQGGGRGPKERADERLVCPRSPRRPHRGCRRPPRQAGACRRRPRVPLSSLKILRHAAVEDEALRRVFRIDEAGGVAELVENPPRQRRRRSFRDRCDSRWCDRRPLHPHLILGAVRHELQGYAGSGKPTKPTPLGQPVHHGDPLRLRRAIHGGEGNAMARLGRRWRGPASGA